MSLPTSSTFTKMRQVYWEAKQSFNKSLGKREDNCIISSDLELDLKLELLQTADNCFNALMRILLEYRDALNYMVGTQFSLGSSLIEYGIKDPSAAGKVMCLSGRAIRKASQRQHQIESPLVNLFQKVEIFQFKATSDALQTVSKMEKARRSYRSGLMWLKNESGNINPDDAKKMKNFRKVQEHVKRLKTKFDGMKLECMQKIDLFLLSRSNLFSHSAVPYAKMFKKVAKNSVLVMETSLKNIPLCLSYNFVALRELNEYSNTVQTKFQQQLSSHQESRKRNGSSEGPETSRDATILDEPLPTAHFPKDASEVLLPPQIIDSGDAPLIDLREERKVKRYQRKTQTEKHSLKSFSKYSDDLLSINFDNYKLSSGNAFLTNNFGIEFPMVESFSQETVSDDKDLQFWSFMRSVDHSSQLLQRGNPKTKNSAEISSISSDSKWNDILVQFDPFLDEHSQLKNDAGILELC